MSGWLIKSKDAFIVKLYDLIWRKWCELGIAGSSLSMDTKVIDPEALLLFSLGICRYEARLFDEIIDWLCTNGHLVNVQRLQQIQKKYNFTCGPQLSAVAGVLAKQARYKLKWSGLSRKYYQEPAEPLFLDKDGTPLPCPKGKDADPEFAAHGLMRGDINLRGLSRSFLPESPACLLLRLRALMGINARCEILCLLASAKEMHPSEAARQTGYYQKTIQTTLVEMAQSGAVLVRKSKKEKFYRLKPGVIDSLVKPNGRIPVWINWASLLKAFEIIRLKLQELSKISLDPLLLTSELNKTIDCVRERCVDADIEKIRGAHNAQEKDVIDQFNKNLHVFFDLAGSPLRGEKY